VAGELSSHGFGTLLFDPLTEEEAEDRRNVFDIPLLGERVVQAVDWASREGSVRNLPIGLFGASTGAAAALVAAADDSALVEAVVSRGGCPDLAGEALARVKAPTLLIVGGLVSVRRKLELNESIMDQAAIGADPVIAGSPAAIDHGFKASPSRDARFHPHRFCLSCAQKSLYLQMKSPDRL
jgi:dienelactone hydrolase